jgi:hypothetical protein
MSAGETAFAIGALVLSSGVVAALVSGVMTERSERRRGLLDRRLNAAGDFVSAAAKASNALEALAQEIHEPRPNDAQADELLEQATGVAAEIDARRFTGICPSRPICPSSGVLLRRPGIDRRVVAPGH